MEAINLFELCKVLEAMNGATISQEATLLVSQIKAEYENVKVALQNNLA